MTDISNNIKEKKRTTVLLEGDAYTLIRKKQIELYEKTEKDISIQDLVALSVKKGLPLVSTEMLENNK